MREAEWQAKIGRDLRAVIGTAEHPDFREIWSAWLCDDVAERMTLDQLFTGQPRQQIAHLRREMIRRGLGQWIEREGGAAIRPGCPAEAKIDAARRDRSLFSQSW